MEMTATFVVVRNSMSYGHRTRLRFVRSAFRIWDDRRSTRSLWICAAERAAISTLPLTLVWVAPNAEPKRYNACRATPRCHQERHGLSPIAQSIFPTQRHSLSPIMLPEATRTCG